MSQMKLKSIGERLGSVENARVRFGDFFKFTNGLVFRFEAVIMGQYGILILIMSFILEFCYAGFQQATVLPLSFYLSPRSLVRILPTSTGALSALELYVLDFLRQIVTERCLRNGLTL